MRGKHKQHWSKNMYEGFSEFEWKMKKENTSNCILNDFYGACLGVFRMRGGNVHCSKFGISIFYDSYRGAFDSSIVNWFETISLIFIWAIKFVQGLILRNVKFRAFTWRISSNKPLSHQTKLIQKLIV